MTQAAIPLPSLSHPVDEPRTVSRDPRLREHYLRHALPTIGRLLTAIDRNPYHATYGCLDRQFWHYRTAAFPSEMYAEGLLPMALVYVHRFPGSPWFQQPLLRELIVAGLRFIARTSHRDGSCDDYYPFERALGASVFSMLAAARAMRLLEIDDPELRKWLLRRARWVAQHSETGRLSNHQALAALGLWHAAEVTGIVKLREAARRRLSLVLSWQSPEGWFDEYGGADPGYQTLTIECLAQMRRLTGDTQLDQPLARGVDFVAQFQHPDGTLGGPYGSRGTLHFYPHGCEILAAKHSRAARLADGFLQSLFAHEQAHFSDDRMFAHPLASLLEAYLDWQPRAAAEAQPEQPQRSYYPEAQILVSRTSSTQTIVSAARGGTFTRYRDSVHQQEMSHQRTDAGLMVELADGRIGTSQVHDRGRSIRYVPDVCVELLVSAPLRTVHHRTANPLSQALLHVAMVTVGRWLRTPVRWLLQRVLIRGGRELPIRHERQFVLQGDELAVSDTITLVDRRVKIKRMSFATDCQTAYTAASGVFQQRLAQPWIDLDEYVEELNRAGRVEIVRQY